MVGEQWGEMRLLGKTDMIIGLDSNGEGVLVDWITFFIDACGDVGRKLCLGKRVNLEIDNCLGPGRQRSGREYKAWGILFSGPWHSTRACSFHTCVPGGIQDTITYPSGPLNSRQEELTQGRGVTASQLF